MCGICQVFSWQVFTDPLTAGGKFGVYFHANVTLLSLPTIGAVGCKVVVYWLQEKEADWFDKL